MSHQLWRYRFSLALTSQGPPFWAQELVSEHTVVLQRRKAARRVSHLHARAHTHTQNISFCTRTLLTKETACLPSLSHSAEPWKSSNA